MMKYLICIMTLCSYLANAQIVLNTNESTMKIIGTSSLHDWEMSVDEFEVNGIMTDTQVKNLQVVIVAKSMKSGKSIMDGKAYDAVKAKEYPEIIFSASELEIIGDKIAGIGAIEIAGEKVSINLESKIMKNGTSQIQLTGSVPLKMTDFNISPPTAMFGTLTTGDEVTIVYNIILTK